MADIEKVIKGLEECAGNGNCTKCQYGKEKQTLSCKKLLADALELLKEQSRKQVLSFADGYADGYKAKDQEIVRCKDCKEGVLCNGDTAYVCSKCIGSLETIVHPGEWYCADGERRTDK